ncbi:MAG TPA: sodium:proton antiporter [Candidatus Limnocylindria bacterium]|nr:sodium:proton antiporter [Candidatus Limnocylindria bacterium]
MHGQTRASRAWLRRPSPGPVAFVLAGAIASVAVPPLALAVTPDLVLAVLLPGLVFEAAYRLRWEDLRRSSGSIAFLAVPGVLVSAGIVAVVLTLATGLRPDLAFVAGAMVSATDPAAVVATFTRLHAPRRLVAIVDAESLLNDGTSLVAFAIAIVVVTRSIGLPEAAGLFAATVVGSVLVGAAIGTVAAILTARVAFGAAAVAISIVAAYGSYLAVAALGLSGVLASVSAGVALGNHGRRIGLGARTERALDAAWEPITFTLTALIFVAVGLAITWADLLRAVGDIAWGIAAVLLGRAVIVYGLIGGALVSLRGRRLAPNVPGRWLHLIFWAGLRGGVATAAALSLPVDFPEREALQRITFGVVVATLLVQGSTAGWLVRRLGLEAA